MEQTKVKKGAQPVSKKQETNADFEFAFGSSDAMMKIDPALAAQFKKDGLVYRWINKKQYEANGNVHRSHWKAYRRDSASSSSADFVNGSNPEGYIVRGDMLLAVRTEKMAKSHRSYLDKQNELKAGIQKRQAQELKELVGSRADVDDGSEDED
jgi:hypothetical protein